MSLGDVHNQKTDLTQVLVVQLVEGGNLPPKGRSSITAENHHHRLTSVQLGKPNGSRFIQLGEGEVRSGIANLYRACAGASPKRFEGHNQKNLPRHVRHYP